MGVFVRNTEDKGRGVFAEKNFKKDEVVDIAHVIIIPEKDSKTLMSTVLGNYLFSWTNNELVLPLNYACLFNHDDVYYNVYWKPDYTKKVITFYADRNINTGEELLHNYGWS